MSTKTGSTKVAYNGCTIATYINKYQTAAKGFAKIQFSNSKIFEVDNLKIVVT